MPTSDSAPEALAARARVLALLHGASAAVPHSPTTVRDWLHRPHPELGGLSPATAAWLSHEGAVKAARCLATWRRAGGVGEDG